MTDSNITKLRDDMYWDYFEGRNDEGEKFRQHVLVHATGRIVAKVLAPVGEQYEYWVLFYIGEASVVKHDTYREDNDIRFIHLEGAKEYAQSMVADYGSGIGCVEEGEVKMRVYKMLVPVEEAEAGSGENS